MLRKLLFFVVTVIYFFHGINAFAESLLFGKEVPVAASAGGQQRFPAVAYAKGVFLIAWQEGRYGWGPEAQTLIRGIRISANGTIIDTGSFAISKAPHLQEKPQIATDGEIFLVVWQDFRNGKDYDIYAARITPEGEVLDPKGIMVAAGRNNQCSPSVSFDGKNFVILWMDNRDIEQSYSVRAARVSGKGVVLEPNGVLIAGYDEKKLETLLQSDNGKGLPMNSFPKIACLNGECAAGWLQKNMAWSESPQFVYLKAEPEIRLIGKPLSIPKGEVLQVDRSYDPSVAIAAVKKQYIATYAGTVGKGADEYYVVGILLDGTGKGDNDGVRALSIRPVQKGVRLSETVSPYGEGFIAIWSEGTIPKVGTPETYLLKGAFFDRGGKAGYFEIFSWSDIYRGAPSISTNSENGMLVYEVESKEGLRIAGTLFKEETKHENTSRP